MGIPELVSALASPDPTVRTKTRKALVAIGKLAVPSLIGLLSHRKPHVRWEAAKALCGIADPLTASALVNALEDPDGDVRWLAAEGVAVSKEGKEGLIIQAFEWTHRHFPNLMDCRPICTRRALEAAAGEQPKQRPRSERIIGVELRKACVELAFGPDAAQGGNA
jgi:hypothetical protein